MNNLEASVPYREVIAARENSRRLTRAEIVKLMRCITKGETYELVRGIVKKNQSRGVH